jgi:REP-associated tyrosine transposase
MGRPLRGSGLPITRDWGQVSRSGEIGVRSRFAYPRAVDGRRISDVRKPALANSQQSRGIPSGLIFGSAVRMARPLRPQGAGLVYHVMARGNNKMVIYRDKSDYGRFESILGQVAEKYELDCWAVCAMPNHYHLAIRTRLPNLSEAMRHLNGVYAQWWNRQHGHVGHVVQARFKAQIVDASVYLLRLVRYIWRNPVRAGLCATPEKWPWSSYRTMLGLKSRMSFVDVRSLLARFGDPDLDDVRARLIAFTAIADDPEIADFIRKDTRVIGSEAFAARFRTPVRKPDEIPARDRRVGTPLLTDLLASSLRSSGGIGEGIVLAHHEYGYRIVEIARSAGLSITTVSRIVRQSHQIGARRADNPRSVSSNLKT